MPDSGADAWDQDGWKRETGHVNNMSGGRGGAGQRTGGGRGDANAQDNLKSKLLALCDKLKLKPALFTMSDPKGSSHKPVFQCVVKVQKVGSEALERYVGEGSNKKAAEQAAAQKALTHMSGLAKKLERSSSGKKLNVDDDEDVEDFPSKPPSSDTALDEDAPVCGADRKAAVAVADAEDDWEALADEAALVKPPRGDTGGRGRGRGRGGNAKAANRAELSSSSSCAPGMSAERAHERGAEGQYTHTYNTGALNFNLTAADLELDADEAKAVLTKSVGPSAGLRFEIAANGAAHAPVFRATIVIPGAGGMMGDLVGRADAANKKTAEKMAALDACVKLAQLGRLVYAPRPSNRGGGGGGGRGGRGGGGGGGPTRSEAKRGPQFAGDVSAVPLCSSREQLDELCRIAQTLVEVPSKPIEAHPSRVDETEDDLHPHTSMPDAPDTQAWNRRHLALQAEREKKPEYTRMLEKRLALPAFQMKEHCVNTIAQNQVTIIAGDTGCGKTTQVPQAYFDYQVAMGRGGQCNCVVTQPRRVSAISVAERVAAERAEPIGDTVGYQIRQESVVPRSVGSIIFCTTGVLTRKLTSCAKRRANGGSVGLEDSGISVVFVDEVHERDVNTDFLLIVLKKLIDEGANIKVVLMSATMNAEKFSHFWGYCPIITIPGRMFEVEEHFIEDYISCVAGPSVKQEKERMTSRRALASRASDAVGGGGHGVESWRRERLERGRERARMANENSGELISLRKKGLDADELAAVAAMSDVNFIDCDLLVELLLFIDRDEREGAILVFLPGWEEISATHEILDEHPDVKSGLSKLVVFRLHSNVSPQEQQEVFKPVGKGKRKVVLSTNIAETSVTIDDCVFVIDSGRAKCMTYDPVTQISSLVTAWAAKANVKQRRGRAGRVREGVCYRLYTLAQHAAMDEEQKPEMLVVPLEQICLSTLALGLGSCKQFLGAALDPPPAKQMEAALAILRDIGATDASEEKLTPLGNKLCQLPMEPRLGKMLIAASAFRCLRPLVAVAAAKEYRDPFVNDERAEGIRVMLSDGCQSDQLLMAHVMGRYQEMLAQSEGRAGAFCHEHMLNPATMRQMNSLQMKLADMVVKAGLCHHIEARRAGRAPGLQALVQCSEWEHEVELVRGIICAGLLPNAARVHDKGAKRRMLLKDGGKISVQQAKSVLQLDRIVSANGFVCFHELIKTNQLFASDVCYAGTLPVAIFCHKVERCSEGILCDGWMRFSVEAAGVDALLAIRAAAKRCMDRHLCAVAIGSKSAQVDLEGVLNALRTIHNGSTHRGGAGDRGGAGGAGAGDRYRDDGDRSCASTVVHTSVLQYIPAAKAFRRELDRVGGSYCSGAGGSFARERGGGGGYDRAVSGRDGHFGDRGSGGGGFRHRDAPRPCGGYGYGSADRYAADRGGGGGDSDRDWRGVGHVAQGGSPANRPTTSLPENRGAGALGAPGSERGLGSERKEAEDGGVGDARVRVEQVSKSRADGGSRDGASPAPLGPPAVGKYVPPSRRIL